MSSRKDNLIGNGLNLHAIHMLKPNLKEILLGHFWRRFVQEGSALKNGISVLTNPNGLSPPLIPFSPCEGNLKECPHQNLITCTDPGILASNTLRSQVPFFQKSPTFVDFMKASQPD
jgi:hypothetical protein